ILVVELHAAHQVRRVLAFGEPACRFTRRAALVEYVHRCAGDRAIADRVRMHRDKQIRLCGARADHAVAQNDEVVTIADEHRAHAGFVVDARSERTGDRERDVFLARAVATDGAWVQAAVARVYRDDDIAIAIGGGMLRAHDFRNSVLRTRERGGRAVERDILAERDDESIARLTAREPLAARRHCRLHLEHDPQRAARTNTGAHGLYEADAIWHANTARQTRAPQIDDDAIGMIEHEHLVRRRR